MRSHNRGGVDRRDAIAFFVAAAAGLLFLRPTRASSDLSQPERELRTLLGRVPELASVLVADAMTPRSRAEYSFQRTHDFAEGSVIRINGWQFAHAELRYLAFLAAR